ncbi:hypothetical protein ABVT39_015267 [Epinephelus coioides]
MKHKNNRISNISHSFQPVRALDDWRSLQIRETMTVRIKKGVTRKTLTPSPRQSVCFSLNEGHRQYNKYNIMDKDLKNLSNT